MSLVNYRRPLIRYGFFTLILWSLTMIIITQRIPNDTKQTKIRRTPAKTTKSPKMAEDFIFPPGKQYSGCPSIIERNLKRKENVFNICDKSGMKCKTVNCYDVITGNKTARNLISDSSHAFRNLIASDKDIINITQKCDNLFEMGGYIDGMLTAEEANFPLAFSILVYKDAGQVERLLRTIYHPNNAYCIHVDLKSPEIFHKAIESIVKCFPNVILLKRPVRVIYAGFSRLYADLLCMRELLKSPHKWKYLINLAGTAMPIKTNLEIVQILSLYNGSNNIEGLPLNRTMHSRFKYKWIVSKNKTEMVRTNITKGPPPYDLTIVRGSAYGAFTRAFVHFVLLDKKANGLLQWSMDTYSPDEHYWATLNYVYHNPQLKTPGGFKGPAENNPWFSSYSLWPTEDLCTGTVTAMSSPCVFGVYAIPDVISRKELFVNKFSASFEPAAQVCLGSLIQQRTKCQTALNIKYYRTLPPVQDRNLIQT